MHNKNNTNKSTNRQNRVLATSLMLFLLFAVCSVIPRTAYSQDGTNSLDELLNTAEKERIKKEEEEKNKSIPLTKERFLSGVENIDTPICTQDYVEGCIGLFSCRNLLKFDENTNKFIMIDNDANDVNHSFDRFNYIVSHLVLDFSEIGGAMRLLIDIRWFQNEDAKTRLSNLLKSSYSFTDSAKKFLVEYDAALQKAVPKFLALQQAEKDKWKQMQAEDNALKEREKAAEIVRRNKQLVYQESQRADSIVRKKQIEQYVADIKSGKVTPKNINDATILLGAQQDYNIILNPPINATGGYFTLVGIVDRLDNVDKAQILTVKFGGQYYFAVQISSNTKKFGKNPISLRSQIIAVGKYTENLDYITVGGQKLFMPLIDAEYVQ